MVPLLQLLILVSPRDQGLDMLHSHYCQQYTTFSAVPLPTMAPEVVDWSERHMRLSWNEPIDDGGAPITGYHVEAKAKTDEEWQGYYKLLRHIQ